MKRTLKRELKVPEIAEMEQKKVSVSACIPSVDVERRRVYGGECESEWVLDAVGDGMGGGSSCASMNVIALVSDHCWD